MDLQELDEHEISWTFCPGRNLDERVYLNLQTHAIPKSGMTPRQLQIYEKVERVIDDFLITVRRVAREWHRYKTMAIDTAEAVKTLEEAIFDNHRIHRTRIKQLMINLNAQGDYVWGAVTRLKHRHFANRPCSYKTHTTLYTLLDKVTSTYKHLHDSFQDTQVAAGLAIRVPTRDNRLMDLHLHQQLRILAERQIFFEGVDYEEVIRCTREGVTCRCLLFTWEE